MMRFRTGFFLLCFALTPAAAQEPPEDPATRVGGAASNEGTTTALDRYKAQLENLAQGRSADGQTQTRSAQRGLVSGRDKAGKIAAVKQGCGNLAVKLERLGKAISIFDVIPKVAGHLVEGDASGALIVIPQELGKQLVAKLGAFLGTPGGLPGIFVGAAAGEKAWKELGGDAAFDVMAQQIKYLEKTTELAGARIRSPKVLEYMRGEITEAELKQHVVQQREQARQNSIAKWKAVAEEFPGLRGDVDALIAGTASESQQKRLRIFEQLKKISGDNPRLQAAALRSWSEGRSTPDEIDALKASWRKKEKARKETLKQQDPPRSPATETQTDLRAVVLSKLSGKGLPTPASVVDRLVGILESGGMGALDTALAEFTGMQGTFRGSLGGKGTLILTVQGSSVTGSWNNTLTDSFAVGKERVTTHAVVSASLQGTVDLLSGSLTAQLTGNSSATTKGQAAAIPIQANLRGSFTGDGFKGTAIATEGSASWSVKR